MHVGRLAGACTSPCTQSCLSCNKVRLTGGYEYMWCVQGGCAGGWPDGLGSCRAAPGRHPSRGGGPASLHHSSTCRTAGREQQQQLQGKAGPQQGVAQVVSVGAWCPVASQHAHCNRLSGTLTSPAESAVPDAQATHAAMQLHLLASTALQLPGLDCVKQVCTTSAVRLSLVVVVLLLLLVVVMVCLLALQVRSVDDVRALVAPAAAALSSGAPVPPLAEQIVDARSAGRFTGVEPEPRPGLRGGHAPGAHNVPFPQVRPWGGVVRMVVVMKVGHWKDTKQFRQLLVLSAAAGSGSKQVPTTSACELHVFIICTPLQPCPLLYCLLVRAGVCRRCHGRCQAEAKRGAGPGVCCCRAGCEQPRGVQLRQRPHRVHPGTCAAPGDREGASAL